jgi:hypothetical protein
MLFNKKNTKCAKCGSEICTNPVDCKQRVIKVFQEGYFGSSNPLSVEKITHSIVDANQGKRIKLLKFSHIHYVSPELDLNNNLNSYDFYGIIGVTYQINWGEELIDAPLWIRVTGELYHLLIRTRLLNLRRAVY